MCCQRAAPRRNARVRSDLDANVLSHIWPHVRSLVIPAATSATEPADARKPTAPAPPYVATVTIVLAGYMKASFSGSHCIHHHTERFRQRRASHGVGGKMRPCI